MQHAQPIPASETEAPFSAYLECAKDQVARSIADGFLSGHRSDEIARALARMNRDADRAMRAPASLPVADPAHLLRAA